RVRRLLLCWFGQTLIFWCFAHGTAGNWWAHRRPNFHLVRPENLELDSQFVTVVGFLALYVKDLDERILVTLALEDSDLTLLDRDIRRRHIVHTGIGNLLKRRRVDCNADGIDGCSIVAKVNRVCRMLAPAGFKNHRAVPDGIDSVVLHVVEYARP